MVSITLLGSCVVCKLLDQELREYVRYSEEQ